MQLKDIENDKTRTQYFHSRVKKDLWDWVSREDPLENAFFRSDYMRALNNHTLFNHNYFSVRSSIETAEKYNDLQLFMRDLGSQKKAALNNFSSQLPVYFYTDHNTSTGRQDRLFLETAWNKNFNETPFPSYYSLNNTTSDPNHNSNPHNRGMSAQQFRSIVNSPEFQKLYQ